MGKFSLATVVALLLYCGIRIGYAAANGWDERWETCAREAEQQVADRKGESWFFTSSRVPFFLWGGGIFVCSTVHQYVLIGAGPHQHSQVFLSGQALLDHDEDSQTPSGLLPLACDIYSDSTKLKRLEIAE